MEKPCAEIDPGVLVLAVRQNDEFVGTVINFATHPATIATDRYKAYKNVGKKIADTAVKKWFDGLGNALIDSTPVKENYYDTFFALQTFLIQADKRTGRMIDLQLFRIGD